MTLQSSGAISLSNVNVELGLSSTATISLGSSNVRTLAGVASGAISMSNLYGKSSAPPPDTTPNAFTFTDQTGVALSSTITSNTITVSGIDAAAAISITGGTYSINGGAYTSTAGTVTNGQTVTVRHTSSGSYSTATNTTLIIGGVSDTFTSTTAALDTTPNAFTFTDQTDVALSSTITSNTIMVSGINGAASISITGGTYSINGGAYTSTTGTVTNGQIVSVSHTSSASYSTATNTTLTIGGVSDTFTSTTSAAPAASFNPAGGTSAGSPVTLEDYSSGGGSATVTITCSQSATWTWTRSGSTAATASVSSGGSATSITFSLANTTTTIRESTFTVSASAGGITRYWSVVLTNDGFA